MPGCGDGKAGLAAFEVFRPDAVLLALRLSGLDDLAGLGRLRGHNRDVRVTMTSANGDVEPEAYQSCAAFSSSSR